MSFHFDPVAMGRDLGVRADAIRISLDMPTRLLRQISGARSFLEIAALDIEFKDEGRSSTCGPKFEAAEKEAYEARRETLFPAYLAEFETIEAFEGFGRMVAESNSPRIELWQIERVPANEKLEVLLKAEIEDAGEDLEKLVSQYERARIFSRLDFSVSDTLRILGHRIEVVVQKKLLETNQVSERVKILIRVKDYAHNIFGEIRHGSTHRRYMCEFIWLECTTLADALLLEDKRLEDFISEKELLKRLVELLNEEMKKVKEFGLALKFANLFADRETYSPDELYRIALTRAAAKVRSVKDLRTFIAKWDERKNSSRQNSSSHQWPNLPEIVIQKWDEYFLDKARTEESLTALTQLLTNSPWGSNTRRVADARLVKHFEGRISRAEDEETIRFIKAEAEGLSPLIYLGSAAMEKERELRRQFLARRIQWLWDRVEAGDPDEKTILISLYHETRNDIQERKKVLLRLAAHYPAEMVDELPLEVAK